MGVLDMQVCEEQYYLEIRNEQIHFQNNSINKKHVKRSESKFSSTNEFWYHLNQIHL